jgi:hypothetical protein
MATTSPSSAVTVPHRWHVKVLAAGGDLKGRTGALERFAWMMPS